MPVHALCAAFLAGGYACRGWTRAFRDRISRIHLVHAFLHIFLVSSSGISPVHTHIFPFASAGTHGIPREMEGLVTEVSRLYAVLNPDCYSGGFFLPLFFPFMLKYNTMQQEKLQTHTHTHTPAALSLLPGLTPTPS